MFGLLKKAKTQLRKAEAAAALENLLKTQAAAGNFDGDSHLVANELISETWVRTIKQAKGTNVPIPHKVSLVAIALAERLNSTGLRDPHFFAYGISLGTVLNTIVHRGTSLQLSPTDEKLIVFAMKVSESVNKQLADLAVSDELEKLIRQDHS